VSAAGQNSNVQVDSGPPRPAAVITTHPLIGIAGVLLGAMIATCTGRLISVGMADIRGALHLGVDEAAWIGTAFNAALMFIGPFSVYLGGLFGARRVLLACGAGFTAFSLVLPLIPGLPWFLTVLVLAGLTAGTFYPLTLSFVLRSLPMKYALWGIAMYAFDILFTTNIATSLEAWYADHLSWHWIFWNGALLTPVMMVLIYFGIPWQPLPQTKEGQPKPHWGGFLYLSLGFSFLYMALDQGQRLDWLHSGVIVALVVTGAFFLIVALIQRLLLPNPLINLRFLARRNTALLSGILIFFRFVLLAPVVAIPLYLGAVQGYRPLQTGPVLLWVALPQLLLGLLAIYLLKYMDARLILTAGFSLVAIACLMNTQLSSVWTGTNFWVSQLVMAAGLALSFNSMVGAIILEVLNTGALERPIDVLTFSGFFQTVRLFGGQVGTAFVLHFIPAREQFHSNILGLGVQMGEAATDQRLLGFTAGLSAHGDTTSTAGRAAAIVGLQVRQQAYTLAISDSFLLLAYAAVFCLALIACMAQVHTQYRHVIATPEVSA
jgi:DHA2 family multidrug resistance protein